MWFWLFLLPLVIGLPQPCQPLQPWACHKMAWVWEHNFLPATGLLSVPTATPHMPPHFNPLLTSTLWPGGSCSIQTTLHLPKASPPTPLLHPHNLPFGDPINPSKPNAMCCIGFCNIGRFPVSTHNNNKVVDIKHFLTSNNLDLFGGCESNLNWRGSQTPSVSTSGFNPWIIVALNMPTIYMKTMTNINLEVPFR